MTTKSLVVLPRQVADAIESLRSEPAWSNERIARLAFEGVSGTCLVPIRSVPFDTLMDALINGYETEKTAEELAEEARQAAHERIRSAYKCRLSNARYAGHIHEAMRHGAFADGIKFALNELGVKISEVNV